VSEPTKPPQTVHELLANWMHADRHMVTSFNEAHITAESTVEARIAFIEMRANNMATALASLMTMLSKGANDGR